MWLRKIIRLFEKGGVCVCGLRGTGKDMLTSNVIARRNLPYVSNVPYGYQHIPLDFSDIDCGGNTYAEFISSNVTPYTFPFPDGTDIYLSDAGVYLPSQYCGELNKRYPYLAVFQALSRHLGQSNMHFNAQNLNRVYDKIREQSDTYVMCNWCYVLFGGRVVLQKVTLYERYESAVARIRPCRVKMPLLARGERRDRIQMYIDDFINKHGMVKSGILLYRNRGDYDTRYFKTLLGGKKDV